MTQEKGRKKR